MTVPLTEVVPPFGQAVAMQPGPVQLPWRQRRFVQAPFPVGGTVTPVPPAPVPDDGFPPPPPAPTEVPPLPAGAAVFTPAQADIIAPAATKATNHDGLQRARTSLIEPPKRASVRWKGTRLIRRRRSCAVGLDSRARTPETRVR